MARFATSWHQKVDGVNWKLAYVVNSHLVCDLTIRQPGFDLPRQQWSLQNRFRTEQGHCGACRRKWRLSDTDLCPCGGRPRRCLTLSNPDKTEWGLISATLCGWRRYFVADQLWFMTRLREEEDWTDNYFKTLRISISVVILSEIFIQIGLFFSQLCRKTKMGVFFEHAPV